MGRAFHLCTLAAVTALLSACVAGAPMPIPTTQVLPMSPANAREAAALRGELPMRGVGGDQLRDRLSAE